MGGARQEEAEVIRLPYEPASGKGWGSLPAIPERFALKFDDGEIWDSLKSWNRNPIDWQIVPKLGQRVSVTISMGCTVDSIIKQVS